MSFINFFKSIFKSSPEILEYKIKCKKCGEIVRVRVFPERDLNPTYEDSRASYILNKEVMDSKCFQIMVLRVEFDSSRMELAREITNGEFV
ncbi:MAG: hypothetical protein AB1765_04025 [Candidatus Hydrogenedentota bacterium]